jgi:peptidoglycan/xylan/chitin deacetylase (PgdA/CDA1 family)
MIILNFHGLGPVSREIDSGEYSCWLDTSHFEAILDRIQGNKKILVTFDDGNSSDHEIALPALMKRGMRAVFFVCSGRIGQSGFLNIAQLHALQAGGMTIGSHGMRHKPWRDLGRFELQEEVAGSRKAIEKICGKIVDLAACPFGSYDRRVLSALRSTGYRAVYTSDGGESRDHQWLRYRTTIQRSFTPARIDQLIHERSSAARRLLNDARILLKRNRPRSFKSLGVRFIDD